MEISFPESSLYFSMLKERARRKVENWNFRTTRRRFSVALQFEAQTCNSLDTFSRFCFESFSFCYMFIIFLSLLAEAKVFDDSGSTTNFHMIRHAIREHFIMFFLVGRSARRTALKNLEMEGNNSKRLYCMKLFETAMKPHHVVLGIQFCAKLKISRVDGWWYHTEKVNKMLSQVETMDIFLGNQQNKDALKQIDSTVWISVEIKKS